MVGYHYWEKSGTKNSKKEVDRLWARRTDQLTMVRHKYREKSLRFSVMIGAKALMHWHASTELPPPPFHVQTPLKCKITSYTNICIDGRITQGDSCTASPSTAAPSHRQAGNRGHISWELSWYRGNSEQTLCKPETRPFLFHTFMYPSAACLPILSFPFISTDNCCITEHQQTKLYYFH